MQSKWKSFREAYQLLIERHASVPAMGQVPAAGAELLANLAQASRGAESFQEAVQVALTTLRDQAGAVSAFLFARREASRDYRMYASAGRELDVRMNRLLHRATAANSYATFFYAQFDEQHRRLRYVNAGHNPPYLLRSQNGNQIEELATGGMIIGMFAQSSYEEASLDVRSGDVLMLFSDGVSEAHNPAEEEFGEERVKDVLRRNAHLPINEMAAQILAELKAWMADAPQHDDLTFVLMKAM